MKWNPYIIDMTHTTVHTLFWARGMPYVKRKSRFYEIEFITGGTGEMTTDGKYFKTSRGDIYFRKPGLVTQGISGYYSYVVAFDPIYEEGRSRCYHTQIPYWIYDNNTELKDDGHFDKFPDCYNTNCFAELEPLFNNICMSFEENKERNQVYMKANLLSIMQIIEKELSDGSVKMKKRSIQNNYNKIIACQEYIDNHLDSKFTLDALAGRCSLSKNFFCKIFKEITGTTPFEYIIQSRMALAKKLIVTTNINIEQIAVLCGFEDRTYFYRQFRKYYQTSPAAMRKE